MTLLADGFSEKNSDRGSAGCVEDLIRNAEAKREGKESESEMPRFLSDLQSVYRTAPEPGMSRYSVSHAKSFAGRMDQLARIRSFAGDIAREAHLDPERTFNLQLAVSEASANAIEHGLPRGNVTLSAVADHERLTVTVSHPGCFRPRVGAETARRHRGMGMPLMLALTDEVVVSHPPGKGTTVSLSLWLR